MTDATASQSALTFRVSEDGLAVSAWGRLPEGDPQGAVAALAADLKARGIAAAPGEPELAGILRAAAGADGAVPPTVIAHGRRPGESRDGRIEWARDFFADGFVEDDAGAVDFWQHRGNPSVADGERVATLFEARRGEDGQDVYGTKLPAPAPAPLRLRAGPNVRAAPAADDCLEFFATVDGRVRFASGMVTVDNVFTVNGNVGLETGWIEHRGAVMVKGDVEAGSRVNAGGDCEVRGGVQSAVLEVGGDLVVRGGIVGRGEEPIRVTGRVQAKFVLDAEIEAGEGVLVESEITHSTIRCRGPIEVTRGRVVAGETTALGSVTVGVAGGAGLSRTLIVSGVDHLWATAVTAREEQIKSHERTIARVRQSVAPLMEREKSLSPSQREAATELLARMSLMENEQAELKAAVETFSADSRARANPRVVVLQKAHPDTAFQLRDTRLVLDQEREGPFRVRIVKGRAMVLPGERDAWGEDGATNGAPADAESPAGGGGRKDGGAGG